MVHRSSPPSEKLSSFSPLESCFFFSFFLFCFFEGGRRTPLEFFYLPPPTPPTLLGDLRRTLRSNFMFNFKRSWFNAHNINLFLFTYNVCIEQPSLTSCKTMKIFCVQILGPIVWFRMQSLHIVGLYYNVHIIYF